jgi:site-specific recombinase XerD
MMLEPIQKCLGHAKLETTQIYAKLSAEMIKTSDQKALGG